jgi:hypothetical protein
MCAICAVTAFVAKNKHDYRLDLYFLSRTNMLMERCHISRCVYGCIFYIENMFIVLYIANVVQQIIQKRFYINFSLILFTRIQPPFLLKDFDVWL